MLGNLSKSLIKVPNHFNLNIDKEAKNISKKAYEKLINSNNIDYCKKIKELEPPSCFKEGKLFGYKDLEGKILCPPVLRHAIP